MRLGVCGLVVGLIATGVQAENALRIQDGRIKYWHRDYEIWCAELEDWRRFGREPMAIYDMLQPLAARGVPTVGISVQQPGRPVFTKDGEIADKDEAKHLANAIFLPRDHHMSTVVSLFSADRSCWLESQEAYCRAAGHVAKLVGKKHASILVIGDLFGDPQWSAEGPCDLRDPEMVLAVARAIQGAGDEPLLGIPAAVLDGLDAASAGDVLAYVVQNPQELTALFASARDDGKGDKLPAGVVALRKDRFFRASSLPEQSDPNKALDGFLREVERKRLAATPDVKKPPSGPREDILTAAEQAGGFEPLFDGRSMQGWSTMQPDWATWSVEDGALACNGQDGQWIRTKKQFSSFVLRLEYKIARNGNSGVFVWAPREGRASRFGMEMQIRGVQKEKQDGDSTGAIYEVVPPKADPSREAGEWNAVEITCRGSHVTIRINDVVVQDLDADKVDALKHRLRRGVIGLQDHGNEVSFRRIRIRELHDPHECEG